ncbi:YdcF family protein [Elioraea sp.]|uniref:YdcF family protein n=1 Tax=Elioraea sp. TaxID=2185103 RepID=UPI00307E1292
MSSRAILTALLLPPLGLALAALVLALMAWRGRRRAGLVAALALVAQIGLATPFASGWLRASLEGLVPDAAGPDDAAAGAIIVLGADLVRTATGADVGPLTLERMRAAAALQRRTGLPLLVTGGTRLPDDQATLAEVMAHRFAADFGLPVRWIEPHARNTRENARFSAALLRGEEIGHAYAVTHAWHLPRALLSFRQVGFPVTPVGERQALAPDGRASDFVPRPDHLARSWFYLREWAGLAFYAWRGG